MKPFSSGHGDELFRCTQCAAEFIGNVMPNTHAMPECPTCKRWWFVEVRRQPIKPAAPRQGRYR